uniref:arogenate dehydratase n=1 Tax=Nelumbo nucifera TaxID=4432 RepID=A0A822Y0F0_NELNU|nr:TPA_asm: hypothetical protein HUJ06_027538 [Nelumbo nucifera]
MATALNRLSTNCILELQPTIKIYIEQRAIKGKRIVRTPSKPYSKCRLKVSVMACIQNDDTVGEITKKKKKNAQPLELETLRRPLSITDLPNSVNQGSRLRVAYQGVQGAFSEAAAEKAYPNCEAFPCEQFDTAFNAVEQWIVDRAVLPIENSLGGSIHRNYDLLLQHSLHIVGEVKLAIKHCLLANHGVRLEDLKRVLSHPQALTQCESTLTKLGVVREAIDDTAGAAQLVFVHKLQDTGAVASAEAARIHGLNILAKNIQDDSDNITRFLMLAREPIIPGTDRPFKIESRPLHKKPLRASDVSNNGSPKYFDYLIYVDFEASMADPKSQNALRHLKEFATFL